MKYIGENAVKKLISLIKGDLATKQPTITASGILKGDGSGTVTAADTQEATLVDVPNGLLKGDGTTISAAVAGTDYIDPENTKDVELVDVVSYNPETRTDTQKKQARDNIGLGNVDNVKQYSADNPPPYPVTSVNSKTGAVTVHEVPIVTTEDNGKFLRVVNGAWIAVEIANANGGSF